MAAGLDWHAGDNVIAVDGEYPSNVYPWLGLGRFGVETRMVQPVRGRVRPDDLRALLDARTRLVSVSFVDWSSGARTDLAAIANVCHERAVLFCVDGIQGVGAVNVERIDGDYFTVMGLGLHRLVRVLADVGLTYRYGLLTPS